MAKKSFKLKERTEFKYKIGDKVVFSITGDNNIYEGIICDTDTDPTLKPYSFKTKDGNVYYAHENQLKLAK